MTFSSFIPFCERLLSLLVVALLVSASVVWSGHLFGRDFVDTARSEIHDTEVAAEALPAGILAALGIAEAGTAPADSAAWRVTSAGQPAGFVVCTRTLADGAQGFAGPTPLYIYVDGTGHIRGIASAENAETADYYRTVAEGLFPQYIGRPLAEAVAGRPDAVSGATYSSRSVIANLEAGFTYAAKLQDMALAPASRAGDVSSAWATVGALLTVLFGIVVSLRYRGVKWLRTLTLVLNIAVLGFWTGQYLSLSLLRAWARGGIDLAISLPAVAILAAVSVMILSGHRRHYCLWACPLGSMQELAYRLPLPKVRLSARAYRVMGHVRLALFSALLFLLWSGLGEAILAHEPFGAFRPQSAPTDVVLLCAAIVVLSIFVPRPWCRALCPLGTALDLAEENGAEKRKKA